jgi:internalin A
MWHTKWDELATDAELKRWRDHLRQQHGVGTFAEDPASIGQALAPSLNRWQQEEGAKSALRLYRKSIVDGHGFIRLDDVAPEEKDRVPIKDLFIEPRVAPGRISPDWDPARWPKTSRLTEAVAGSLKLVLLGDPGSGKSTLVDWLTWELAADQRGLESLLRRSVGDLLPLPLILRDLDVLPGITWDKLLNSFIEKTAGGQLTLVDVRALLRDGKALIMLDGLDEISQIQARRDLRDAVREGMATYPRCRWLLTSREVGYEEVPYHMLSAIGPQGRSVDAPPDEAPGDEVTVTLGPGKDSEAEAALDQWVELAYVAPFDDEQVEAFAGNWFRQRERSQAEVEQRVTELLSAVRSNESTTRLGRIPFLLTMMAVIHRNKARLPDGRALLYGRIVDAYLEDIDSRRRLEDLRRWQERLSNFGNPAGIRKRWLSRIGFEMQRLRAPGNDDSPAAWHLPGAPSGEILASKAQFQQWVSQAMRDTRYEAGPAEAGEFLDYITKRSGLLVARGEDRYAFVHLSFQEYFAGCFLQEQVVSRGWATGQEALIAHGARPGDFNHYARDHRWRETLVFLVELMAAEKPDWLELVWPCLFGDGFADLAAYREDTGAKRSCWPRWPQTGTPDSPLSSASLPSIAAVRGRWPTRPESPKRSKGHSTATQRHGSFGGH